MSPNDGHIDESGKIRLPAWLKLLDLFIAFGDNPIFFYNYEKWKMEWTPNKARRILGLILYVISFLLIYKGNLESESGILILCCAIALSAGSAVLIVPSRKFNRALYSVLDEMDKDKISGTLELLFVTPLSEKDLFVGKSSKGLILYLGILSNLLPGLVVVGIPWIIKYIGNYFSYTHTSAEINIFIGYCFLPLVILLFIFYLIILGSFSECMVGLKFPTFVASIIGQTIMVPGVGLNIFLGFAGIALIIGFGSKLFFIGLTIYLLLYWWLLKFSIGVAMDNGIDTFAKKRRPGNYGGKFLDASQLDKVVSWRIDSDS